MKPGRNDPCPCGSALKYKRCCGRANAQDKIDAHWVRMQLDKSQSEERLRNLAEGRSKNIISTEVDGIRIVAVGNKVYYSRAWRYFPDFLIDFLKDELGREWGSRELARNSPHPLFKWLGRMNDVPTEIVNGRRLMKWSSDGRVLAVFLLAYSLYLIAHQDKVPRVLLKRIRNSQTFLPSMVETLAYAAFCRSGFNLRLINEATGSDPSAEFTAKSQAGKVYNVEVKFRSRWSNNFPSNDFFQELHIWVQRTLYKCAKKGLSNPIYWFEIAAPGISNDANADVVRDAFVRAIREAEGSILINGERPVPAYVFLSNFAALSGKSGSDERMLTLEGFHIPMGQKGEQIEIETALEYRDRDRDVMSVLRMMREVQVIPQRFDGIPNALLGEDLEPIGRMLIGDRVAIEMPTGQVYTGVVLDAVGMKQGEEATIILEDENDGKRKILSLPLTKSETRAYRQVGDLVFGKKSSGKPIPDDDPLAIYDFFYETYQHSSREKLIEFLKDHPKFDDYRNLSQKDLAVRVCREWTKAAVAQTPTT